MGAISTTGRIITTGATGRPARTLGAVGALLVCSVLALGLASPASADTFVYTYQGLPFNNVINGYVCSPGPCEISGSFTVSTQLSAGLSDATVTPGGYSFNDGNGFSLSSCAPMVLCSGITVTGIDTDAAGDITAWDVAVLGCFGHCYLETDSIGFSGDISFPGPLVGGPEGFNAGTPGTWTCEDMGPTGSESPCPVAPPPSTPEPSCLYLLGAGLLSLGAVGRKRLA
jgi:hypothetical protein